MALNFPASPALNQVYTAEGRSFVWNGTVWIMRAVALPYATQAEVIAGARADRLTSPATSRARTDQIPRNTGGHPFTGTPTNMLPSRQIDVNYQNTLGRPMLLSVWGNITINILAGAGAVPTARFSRSVNMIAGWSTYAMVLIPQGWWYRVETNGTTAPLGWTEYR